MKSLRFLFAFLMLGFVLSSCQKDYSFEAGNAKGTLAKDGLGDCVPSLVNGNYYKDTALNATNYVDVQVDITKVGVYTITTDTVNGYYFVGTGSTGVLGLNTVRLFGKGKPVINGFDSFNVSFNGSTCTFDVAVNLGTGGGGGTTAKFTFASTGSSCTGATQTPNFYATLPTNPTTHYITLLVDVTQTGTYSLSTTTTNGLTFTGSGSFTSTGTAQPLILRATGTPTASGNINFTFSTTAPASSCGFDLTVQAAPAAATFTFNCGTASFLGTYQVGTAMTSSNTITVPITVGTPGGYTLTTTVNGVTFAAAGVLTATTSSITLNASGTPTPAASPSTTFVLSGGGGPNCSVTIPFTTAPVSTNFISANINGATTLTTFNVGASAIDITGTGNSINIFGDNNATGIENIDFTVAASSIVVNTDYTVNQLTSGILLDANYSNASNVSYSDQSGLTPQTDNPFTVRFTSITTSPNRVKGTFKGRVDDGGTGFVYFTNGTFDITY